MGHLYQNLCWTSLLKLMLFSYGDRSQLFGEEDADQEVSPDTADPEASCESIVNFYMYSLPQVLSTYNHPALSVRLVDTGPTVSLVSSVQGTLPRRRLGPWPPRRTGTSSVYPPRNGHVPRATTPPNSLTRCERAVFPPLQKKKILTKHG